MKSVMTASRAVEELAKLLPSHAHIIRNDEIIDVPLSELKKGDLVLVRPGEKIPSDGIVVKGESYVNEALLTGEAKPVYKKPGEIVIGGSINGDGMLIVKIEKTGKETFLGQIIDLVKKIQESRSRTQDLANRAAFILTPLAIGSGIITLAYWTLSSGNVVFAVERMVAVMVVTCPHALGLAIPLVVAISTSILARNGILVRNRGAFEEARNITAVIFDKTGTLTKGEFEVSGLAVLSNKYSDEDILRIASSLEVFSEHVIARGIVKYADERGIKPLDVEDFKIIPGMGVRGTIEGKLAYVGGAGLLKRLGIVIDEKNIVEKIGPGKTVVYVVYDGELIGVIGLADTIRDESFEAVKELRDMGIKVYILTGDSEEAARIVAETLGVDGYFAKVLPEEKAAKIKVLQQEGNIVAMVGDGVNDASA